MAYYMLIGKGRYATRDIPCKVMGPHSGDEIQVRLLKFKGRHWVRGIKEISAIIQQKNFRLE
jgi:hypothetical protein